MSVWVDCSAGPNSFGAFQADLGEYIGPWPLMPPAVSDGLDPTTLDIIGFIIALPNPAAPTDVTQMSDGTYPTELYEAYLELQDPGPPDSVIEWLLEATGGATVPDGSTPPPAGYHLYVIAYANVGAPPYPPEHYAPASYVSGGTAPFEYVAGGWSDWQPGLSKTSGIDAGRTTQVGWAQGQTVSDSPYTAGNVNSYVNDSLDIAVAPSPNFTNGSGSAPMRVQGRRVHPFPTTGTVSGRCEAGQVEFKYTASTPNGSPVGAPGGVDPDDVGERPFGLDPYEFVDDDPADFEWEDMDVVVHPVSSTFTGAAAGLSPLTGEWDLKVLTSDIAAGTTPVESSGTPLATISARSDYGSDQTTTVAIATDDSVLRILVSTGFALTGNVSTTDAPDFSGVGEYDWSNTITLPSGLGYQFTTTEFRYWLPNHIEPAGIKWHMVGGHYAPVGDVALQILTPGVGWVDIVDGPA